MDIPNFAKILFDSFFNNNSMILCKSDNQIKEEIYSAIEGFKYKNEKQSFLLSMVGIFNDEIISKIEKQKNTYGVAILHDSDRFLKLFDWLQKVELSGKKKANKLVTIVRADADIKLDLFVELLHQKIFKETNKEDIVKVFSIPMVKPTSKLKLNITNKAFLYLLILLQEKGVLINRQLYSALYKLEAIYSQNNTLLKEPNFSSAKNDVETSKIGKAEERIINSIINSIRLNK